MIQHDATLKRMELLLGLVSKEEVIAWADDAIARMSQPHPILFDLSLAGNRTDKDIVTMLGQLGDGGDPAEVAATVFHRFCRSLHHDLKSGMLKSDEVAHRLYRVAWQTELQVPEDSAQFCNWVDDEFALVRQGIKERGPAEDALLEFLRKFDDTSTALM